jgi:hypothetical protein
MKRTPTPVTCDRCGSVYLHEAEFKQYRGGFYSSGVGGEISPISHVPQRIWICICGEPVPDPSIRRAGQDARSFSQSVAAAKAYRARQRPEGSVAGTVGRASSEERTGGGAGTAGEYRAGFESDPGGGNKE